MSAAESILPGNTLAVPTLYAVGAADSYESTLGGNLVKPEVLDDLAKLQSKGVDAQLVNIAPRHELAPGVQDAVDRQAHAIGKLSAQEAFDTIADPLTHSAGAIWGAQNKRAIALVALIAAGSELPHKIAPGIDPAIYDKPLDVFSGQSAADLLRQTKPDKAEMINGRYVDITSEDLIDKPYYGNPNDSAYLRFIEENGFPFLGSREIMTGVVDSRAVDTRGTAASVMALEHVLANEAHFRGHPLVTASLACGAAQTIYELGELFEKNGIEVGKHIIVDNDPMALASAVSLGETHGRDDITEAFYEDLIKTKLTDYIEPHSVDIVDVLGIVDYLRTRKFGYKMAADFLGSIRDIVRPGGLIVAGNALATRPQQQFFDKVWPDLEQRDPVEMAKIVRNAGYDLKRDLTVRVPQREGVYGIYGIAIPESERKLYVQNPYRRAARAAILFNY
jgi:hypothetical protein